MTNNLSTPTDEFSLRHTNVSNPSIIHKKPSQQSITASEDYYSLSGSTSGGGSGLLVDERANSFNSIHRFHTPPSRYRTPLQSRDHLPSQSRDNLPPSLRDATTAPGSEHAIDEEDEPEMRKTPMRGQGKRRSYPEGGSGDEAAGPSAPAALREGGIRRKPVPSTVMEADSPQSQEYIDPAGARSSVARDLRSPPTPGDDDTPYIRFAIDQLTRDEEVRGSRRYPGGMEAVGAGAVPANEWHGSLQQIHISQQQREQQGQEAIHGGFDDAQQEQQHPEPRAGEFDEYRQQQQHEGPHHGGFGEAAAGAGALGAGAAVADYAAHDHAPEQYQNQPQAPHQAQDWQEPPRRFDEPPPRDPRRSMNRDDQDQDLFVPVTNEGHHHQALNFLPGTLRPLRLLFFLLFVLAFLVALLFCAIWSLTHMGLWNYGHFGDSRYFVFEYLPTLIGMIVIVWLVQIEVAVYRIAPFIAMSSDSPRTREDGAHLPLYPKSFLLPYLGHFRAKQPVVGFFMLISWLQIWTIPLLASSFNVHFAGHGATARWRWIATASMIWGVISIYILLIIALVLLFLWLRRQQTGLRWDPRSLADIVCILERSNALSLTDDEKLRHDAPRLGYWRTGRGGNEVFHSYGIADKSTRMYALEDGRIREKPSPAPPEPKSRFSDPDFELGREQRHSREKMLPKHLHGDDEEGGTGGRGLPWFLRPSAALLWIIMALVLLLAFLIVSYIPSTRISKGFTPAIPAPVNNLGYSGTNFLYSFLPALLAMICFLGFLDIDYAYRRLQPYASLLSDSGSLAEKSILLSYVADLPGFVTASALINRHLKLAYITHIPLIAAALPILGGGVFWAEFDTRTQNIRIYPHMPGYYALTVFVAIYAFAFLLVFPSKKMREIDRHLPRRNKAMSFQDILTIFHQSKMLDDVAFHSPASKTDLVTRLLSAPPGGVSGVGGQHDAAAASKVSLADSVRGFGRARQQAAAGLGAGEVPRYVLGRYQGRDGKEYSGVDRLRS